MIGNVSHSAEFQQLLFIKWLNNAKPPFCNVLAYLSMHIVCRLYAFMCHRAGVSLMPYCSVASQVFLLFPYLITSGLSSLRFSHVFLFSFLPEAGYNISGSGRQLALYIIFKVKFPEDKPTTMGNFYEQKYHAQQFNEYTGHPVVCLGLHYSQNLLHQMAAEQIFVLDINSV